MGEHGRLDMDRLRRYTSPFTGNRFYVWGPPPMIRSAVALLKQAGVDSRYVHRESFAL